MHARMDGAGLGCVLAGARPPPVGVAGRCRWRFSVMPSVHLSAMGPGHAAMLIIWNALQLLACAGCVYSAFASLCNAVPRPSLSAHGGLPAPR